MSRTEGSNMKTRISLLTFCLGLSLTATAWGQVAPPWMPPPPAPLVLSEVASPLTEVRADDESELKLRKFGFGVEFRQNMVPEFFLNLFMRAAHEVNTPSYAMKFIYRTKNTDVIIKGSYWAINAPDGNWMGIGHDWEDMEYTEFKDFRFAWGQVNVMWNQPLITGLYFIYGGGIGAGAVMGDIYTTPAYNCTADNWRNATTNPLGGCWHMNNSPEREKEDVPRVMAALEATLGLRYDLFSNVSFKLETGLFLPGFWHLSASVELLF